MLFKGLLESIVLVPYNMLLQIVAAIKRILYATDEDDGAEPLSPIEEKAILETQNRKKHLEHRCRCCWKYHLLRQRLSDVSDVHCSGSPLLINMDNGPKKVKLESETQNAKGEVESYYSSAGKGQEIKNEQLIHQDSQNIPKTSSGVLTAAAAGVALTLESAKEAISQK
ncbi:hypothetical protein Goshw_026327 [Gossypium schwendimanii]|uniref:Uncharacterized protein n=1 Tax=Gossypium schwendimanii TaxID=34291 RepID=A0A7J9LYE0_GOSSC|nr:hypothetical protein [Gossypium schwendimanii]